MDARAQKLLDKSKIEVMLNGGTFLTSIILQLKHELSEQIPTAATNGKWVKYNPSFIRSITPPELVGLMLHEAWHIALLHLDRCKDVPPIIWNMAGDYVINIMITDAGFKIPKCGLLDPKYRGWTTHEVAKDLMNNPPPSAPDFEGDLEYPSGADKEELEQANEEIRNIVIKAYNQAKLSNEVGNLPADLRKTLDDIIQPKLDWKQLMNRFIDSNIKEDYSFKRPNRKFMPEFIMPSAYSEHISHITVARDTSGSVYPELQNAIAAQIKYLYETFTPERLTVIDCDCEIHRVFEITDNTEIDTLREFHGGGGTSFFPVMDWCKENGTNVLVYFTDMYGDEILNSHGYTFPTLWICYSEHPGFEYGETIHCPLG